MGIKWGVIGCGGVVRNVMGRALVEAKGSEFAAVMDVDAARARTTAERFGVNKVYGKLDDLLGDEEIQAVYVATPVHLHKDVTLQAAQAGKHVLCEKPMALDEDECQSMIEGCRECGVKLMVGFMMRFHVCHRKAKAMIESGALGKLIYLRAQQCYRYPPTPGAWRQQQRYSGGGSITDAGSHCIDLIRFLVGEEVRKVAAFTGNLAFDYEVEDTATLLMQFASGVQGIVDACYSTPDGSTEDRLEVYGTKGSLVTRHTVTSTPAGEMDIHLNGKSEAFRYEPVDLYIQQVEEFMRCIAEDREPAVTGEDGLRTQQIMSAAYTSAAESRIVELC